MGKSGPKARLKSVVDGQLVEIPVLLINRTVGTQRERVSREWKNRSKAGNGHVGKSAWRNVKSRKGAKKSSEAHKPAVEKSHYSFTKTRTVNRHRWMRRES